MCLIACSWLSDARYALVLAGNRDEYYVRQSRALSWWDDLPGVLGGRDLEAGGTWLALSRSGRLAAVTNFREPARPQAPDAISRGALVTAFLEASDDERHLRESETAWHRYAGFNLLAASGLGTPHARLWNGSNRPHAHAQALAPGVYGLSNGALDEAWPKVRALKRQLAEALVLPLAGDARALSLHLVACLADPREAAVADLPHTGVSAELERKLSAGFVQLPGYGTRASSVVLVDYHGQVSVTERAFDAHGVIGTRSVAFGLAGSSAAS